MSDARSNGRVVLSLVLIIGGGTVSNLAAAELSRAEAVLALRKAARFFREQVSADGGYLWLYSADLTQHEGESRAKATTVWVQPPGTPTVGQALLTAYRRTGDSYLLQAARDAARVLVRGQLQSGGWDYRSYYTLNDNTLADMITTMFEAADVYDEPKYHDAAKRGGDFLLLAQMPDPQPAWAQQYNVDMFPAWARRFEPPSVTGGESQGAIRILMEVYRKTGEAKYLEPIPRALDYLHSSELADGRLARFYELKTNRPLYFTKDYQLTYRDDDMPTHYSFKSGSGIGSLRAQYQQLRATSADAAGARGPRRTSSLTARATAAVQALDERGAWVESGRLRTYDDSANQIINCRTFVRRVDAISRFIEATQ